MISVPPERISKTIGSIYDATLDPSRWASALQDLEELFHGSKACFGRTGPEVQPNDVIATRVDPVFERRFFDEHANQPSPYLDALAAAPTGLVYGDHKLLGGDTLKRTRFWNEWMAPQDMYDGIGCKVLKLGSSCWYVDVQRGRGQPAFGEQDLELLQLIAPHLARAAEIRRNFQHAGHLSGAISELPFGVIVTSGHMQIATLNAAAEAILERPGSGLLRKGGRLTASRPGEMITLRAFIENACYADRDVLPGTGGDLLIRAEKWSSSSDLALSVGPLMGDNCELPFTERHAAIFVRELSLKIPTEFKDQARAFFGLTPKEAVLAASLASGLTLTEAAVDAGIRISTARSYLARIFSKTHTHQQSELVAMLKSAQSIVRRTLD